MKHSMSHLVTRSVCITLLVKHGTHVPCVNALRKWAFEHVLELSTQPFFFIHRTYSRQASLLEYPCSLALSTPLAVSLVYRQVDRQNFPFMFMC